MGDAVDGIRPIIERLLAREGGYVHHSADRGGPTNYGITEAVARRHGYTGHMRDLPRDLAIAIYEADYVRKPGFDRIHAISPTVAEEVIDIGVNMGPATATRMLQRMLRLLGPDTSLEIDGRLGPRTLGALDALVKRRTAGERALLVGLRVLRGSRYIAIVEADPSQRAFLHGWLVHRVRLS